jgi:hypothetical protein
MQTLKIGIHLSKLRDFLDKALLVGNWSNKWVEKGNIFIHISYILSRNNYSLRSGDRRVLVRV